MGVSPSSGVSQTWARGPDKSNRSKGRPRRVSRMLTSFAGFFVAYVRTGLLHFSESCIFKIDEEDDVDVENADVEFGSIRARNSARTASVSRSAGNGIVFSMSANVKLRSVSHSSPSDMVDAGWGRRSLGRIGSTIR